MSSTTWPCQRNWVMIAQVAAAGDGQPLSVWWRRVQPVHVLLLAAANFQAAVRPFGMQLSFLLLHLTKTLRDHDLSASLSGLMSCMIAETTGSG